MAATILQNRIQQIFNTRLNAVFAANRGAVQPASQPEPAPVPPAAQQHVERLRHLPMGKFELETSKLICDRYGCSMESLYGDPDGPQISTYMGWVARGRQVTRGANGFKVVRAFLLWLSDLAATQGRRAEASHINEMATSYRTGTLFHISQTTPKKK